MLKKWIMCSLFVVLFSYNLFPRAKCYNIKIGSTYSSFIGETNYSIPSFLVGVGKEWVLFKNTTIAGEMLFYRETGLLKNKTIGPFRFPWMESWTPSSITFYDIHLSRIKLEMPILIKQYIRAYKDMQLQLHWGLFLNMLFKDKSSREIIHRNIYYEYTPELKNYPYDYYTIADYESGSYNGSFLYSGLGFGFIWSRAEFEFRYNRKHIRWVDYVKVNEMLETYQMIFGFKF